MRLMLTNKRYNGKGSWVAEVTGTDPQYGLARRFLKGHPFSTVLAFTLEPGRVYDVAEPEGQRRFVTFSIFDQEPRTIGYGEVLRLIEGGLIEDDDWEPAVKRATPPQKLVTSPAWDDLSDL